MNRAWRFSSPASASSSFAISSRTVSCSTSASSSKIGDFLLFFGLFTQSRIEDLRFDLVVDLQLDARGLDDLRRSVFILFLQLLELFEKTFHFTVILFEKCNRVVLLNLCHNRILSNLHAPGMLTAGVATPMPSSGCDSFARRIAVAAVRRPSE